MSTGDRVGLLACGFLAVLVLVVVLAVGHAQDVAARCQGGADAMDPFGADYRSDDGVHWTATYPCIDGGSTTVPIARNRVPGGGR